MARKYAVIPISSDRPLADFSLDSMMRTFLSCFVALLVVLLGSVAVFSAVFSVEAAEPIDRHALVSRHNLELTKSEPVQVGNGEFAFTADITGLQSFEQDCTMSHWGWHSSPLPQGQTIDDFHWTAKPTHGRSVEYPMGDDTAISRWHYANPHRLNLGRIALRMQKADGSPVQQADLKNARQTLDLWTGILTSRFEVDGQPVQVVTCCHPSVDAVAVKITSPLIAAGRLRVEIGFPYPDLKEFGGYGDWNKPDAHETQLTPHGLQRANLHRKIDGDEYDVAMAWSDGCKFSRNEGERHLFTLSPDAAESVEHAAKSMEFVCAFAAKPLPENLPSVDETVSANTSHWPTFWTSGGAIDLSQSKDPRWKELERRIVLSQYLMAVNEAGSLPPQESGLVNNGWNGKFHYEMIWWHAAHYALWDRWPLAERSLGIYEKVLPLARERAQRQGYPGARWPKCTGPEGRESPHPIHAMLIWQQPHPIFFAELDYRLHPTRQTLEKWQKIIFETADFMAAFPAMNNETQRLDLGPPIFIVSENTNPDTAKNPTFELSYWRFGLRLAQTWRERLGLPRDAKWQKVLDELAPLPQQEGLYVQQEGTVDMWTKWNWEHPSLIGAFGWLPGDGVDRPTMLATLHKVLQTWKLDRTWGWDFPMLAMTAARLGEPESAVDLLLTPSPGFQFNAVGLCTGGPFPYFPANGGLLYATALMAAGWDGAPDRNAPGFPDNGQWTVRHEGLKPAP
jgi:hypothetical protein